MACVELQKRASRAFNLPLWSFQPFLIIELTHSSTHKDMPTQDISRRYIYVLWSRWNLHESLQSFTGTLEGSQSRVTLMLEWTCLCPSLRKKASFEISMEHSRSEHNRNFCPSDDHQTPNILSTCHLRMQLNVSAACLSVNLSRTIPYISPKPLT